MPGELALIEQQFCVHEQTAVHAYLSRHPTLVPVLLEAAARIRSCFPQSQVTLEVVIEHDRVQAEDKRCLVAYIATALEPSRAMAQLNTLYTTWWFQVPADVRRWLNVDLEWV